MSQSETIGALAAALSKAQASITGALKDSANPFFKSKYADLASCWDACRRQLTENNLAIIQTVEPSADDILLVTTLAHSSGEWMASRLPIRAKDNSPQAQGSAITYARRYALAAIVGLAQIDDDAEAAQGRGGFTVDPRGDRPKQIDEGKVHQFAAEFLAAFNLDAEEKEIASAVHGVHQRIANDHDLYIAVADSLTAKERSAIKKYIEIYRRNQTLGELSRGFAQ
jgi:hypothetical protein